MDQIKYEGKSILSKGYGIIPKLVMQSNISIEAKSIYAYMCSFAGNGETAFPSIEKIIKDLNISESRFYRHRKQLIEHGFIKVQQNKLKGKVINNTYIILQVISNKENGTIDKPYPQNKGTEIKPYPQIACTEIACTEFACTENEGSNNNKTNNNKTNNNNINNNNIDVVVNMDFQKLLKGFDEKEIKTILKFCFENEIRIEIVEEKLKVINGMKKVNNRVGALIAAIKDDWQPSKGQVNNCNFSQRDYDYDDLEKKLLGWEEE
ncbi:helix-turn-helix domain-containing protein [Clostridium perfringens]|uniref:helix-turn-helix domain-containing protein n=1 Tax=Clostridium perfringens TaxID=1502 RepID=UPI0028CCE8E3|nr:helix-turn-helix domain-containing protein [Clostridium perfringens]MDT7986951.1 helix-turn-helix domain-containing protein [Clostridium perfringens]